jgi:hypothetical protein
MPHLIVESMACADLQLTIGSGAGAWYSREFMVQVLITLPSALLDYAALEARWIDRALADRARLGRVDSLTGAQVVGRRAGNYAGMLIPYFHPGSDRVREYRLRRDQPEYEYDSAGVSGNYLVLPQFWCSGYLGRQGQNP